MYQAAARLSVPVNNAADTRAAEPTSGELASRSKRQAYAPRSPVNDIVGSHGGELPHSLLPELISREAVCSAPPAGCTPVQSSSRLLRPPEQRRRPIRFRKVKRKNKDIIDSRVKANEFSEMSADSGKRFRRTEQQKRKDVNVPRARGSAAYVSMSRSVQSRAFVIMLSSPTAKIAHGTASYPILGMTSIVTT
jgi:hypothetical protein